MRFRSTKSIFKSASTEEGCSLPSLTLSTSLPPWSRTTSKVYHSLLSPPSPHYQLSPFLVNRLLPARHLPPTRALPSTWKSCRLESNDSLLRHILTIGSTFITQIFSWCMQCPEKNVVFNRFESNINRVLATWLHTGIGFKEEKEMEQGDWVDVPVDLWKEVGKRLVSRLDILRFRSVCKAWRSCVPSPTRFPLWVPQPPCDDELLSSILNGVPHFITERSFYMADAGWDSWPIRRVLMEFEEADQGGKFRRYAFGPSGFNIGLPEESSMTPGPNHKLSFVGKAYLLRLALPKFDSLGVRVKGKWSFHETCMEVCKIVLISSNADSVDASNYYTPASELSVVALLASSQQLAVLRLGGSQDPHWGWDTSFCSDTFMDIATYKGQLCAVDFWGTTSVMDYNSLQMTRVAAPLSIYPQVSGWKQLIEVEACGDLYLVVKPERCYAKVYKLNLQLHKWVEVHNIGNQVFFRQESCSISIPTDVLVAGNYERVMSTCKGKCCQFEPHSLVFAHQHPHGDDAHYQRDRFCLLGLSMYGCTPRQKVPTPPSVVTTTSSILSQCDRSVIGRTNYQALADSLL